MKEKNKKEEECHEGHRGSWGMALGALILIVGLVLLLVNYEVITLDISILKFWPIIFVLLGLKMIMKHRM